MQRGHALEKIIGSFSSFFFMNDFVLLNPKYRRAGLEKELADLLLVLDNACIVLSVKGTDGKAKDMKKLRPWLKKKTLDGVKQAKGGINWLDKVSFSGTDLWGEIKTFEPKRLKPICGIVLLECSQERFSAIEFDIPNFKSKVPIHYLSVNDFLNVVQFLESIWDVFHYFEQRSHIAHIFTGINQEHPVFAYYYLRSNDLKGILSMQKNDLEELRDYHVFHRIDCHEEYKERDRLARYVNAIIYSLHKRHPSFQEYCPEELKKFIEPEQKRTAYLKMATMLNELSMSQKVWLGRKLYYCRANVHHSGGLECFGFKPSKSDVAFAFVHFSRISRTERSRGIFRLLPAALYSNNVTEGLGIGIDADDENAGFELCWLRGYRNFTENDKELARIFFPSNNETWVADPFGRQRLFDQ